MALLQELKNEGKPIKTGELVKRAMSRFPRELTPTELQRRTPSGTFWWPGRFRYDLDRLKKSGEVRSPAKGYWEIRPSGISRLANSRLSKPKRKYLDWMEEAIQAIKAGEVPANITIKNGGFTVRLGKEITETKIELGGT